jgi:multidrug efflux pump
LGGGQQSAPDLIGTIFIEMTDRRDRDIDGFEVENQYRDAVANLPGARAEVVTIEEGPPVGKAIQLELSGDDLEVLFA